MIARLRAPRPWELFLMAFGAGLAVATVLLVFWPPGCSDSAHIMGGLVLHATCDPGQSSEVRPIDARHSLLVCRCLIPRGGSTRGASPP